MDDAGLVRATAAAAQSLAARGTAARADGALLTCTYAGGARVILRNSWQHVPTFSGEQLADQIANAIVRALVAR